MHELDWIACKGLSVAIHRRVFCPYGYLISHIIKQTLAVAIHRLSLLSIYGYGSMHYATCF